MKSKNSRQLGNAANRLRAQICKWFGADGSERIILMPGILIGLRLLIGSLKIRKLLLTTEEYYEPSHFPGLAVQCSSPDGLVSAVDREKPDALLMSVVTWRGRPLNLRESFQRIIKTRKRRRPLLIADYAHAGAIGFPEIRSLGADVTVGDLTKWVFPPGLGENLAFLHVTDRTLHGLIEPIFRGFYLATMQSLDNSARWLSPSEIVEVQDWIGRKLARRSDLIRQHERDRKLADRIAKSHATEFQSCIGWLPVTSNTKSFDLGEMLWRREEGIRILCRDLKSQKKRVPVALAKLSQKSRQIPQKSPQ